MAWRWFAFVVYRRDRSDATGKHPGQDVQAAASRQNTVADRPSRTLARVGVNLLLGLSALLVSASVAVPQQRAHRIALFIGNANYPDASTPLPTLVKDARTLAEEFRRLNFEVDVRENANKDDMKRAIDALIGKARSGTEVLFYFSGFGLQAGRRSYLIPVDAQIWSEADVTRDGVGVDSVLFELNRKGAKVKIVVIDAARRNPFERRYRASAAPQGLAPLGAPEGTLALFSAAPGSVVNDREGGADNSILVNELIKELRSPNQTAEQAFGRTRIGVSRASNAEIVPWVSSSLIEEYYFTPPTQTSQRPSGDPTPSPNPPPSRPPPVDPPQRPTADPTPPPAYDPPPGPPPSNPPSIPDPPIRQAAPSRLNPGQVFRDCGDCPEMVAVPAGSFMMGGTAEYEIPAHRVAIDKPFAIGRYEVTFADWARCKNEGGCAHSPGDRGWGRDNRPVMDISWIDAKAFAAWLSKKTGQTYRLPSEAEWEYAARAGTRTPYWWGADVGSRHANCRECNTGEQQRTLPVGSFQANAFGLFDMAGNVAEWTEDCWNDNYRGAPADGSAWAKGQCRLRVLRGGAYDSQPTYLGSGARFRYDYDVRYSANGFRLVRDIP